MGGISPRSSKVSGAGRNNKELPLAELVSGAPGSRASAPRAPPSKSGAPNSQAGASRSGSSVSAPNSTAQILTGRWGGPMPARESWTSASSALAENRVNPHPRTLTPFVTAHTPTFAKVVITHSAAEVQRADPQPATEEARPSLTSEISSTTTTTAITTSLEIPGTLPILSSFTSVAAIEPTVAESTRARSAVFPRPLSQPLSHSQPLAAASTSVSISTSVPNPALAGLSFCPISPVNTTPHRGAFDRNLNLNLNLNLNVDTHRTFSSTPTSPSHPDRRALNPSAKSFQSQPLAAASTHTPTSASVPAQLVTPPKLTSNISGTLVVASPLNRPGDTPEQQLRISNVMSAFREIGDDYDSIEWLHSEAPTSQRESPETLTIPPRQAGLYTSVGSLAPAANQHFTAPNRIQRDGTGRRAPQYSTQGRGHDGHFGVRNMNHHHGRNQYGAGAEKNASQACIPTTPTIGSSAPAMYSGNVPLNRRDVARRHDASLNPLAETFNMGGPGESYRFPPPGLARPGQANLTESGFGQQTVSSFGSFEPTAARQQQQLRGGRPQPLTAGPPGQRQSATGLPPGNRTVVSSASNPPVLPAYSPWIPNYRGNTSTSAITDTLPLEEVRQYYPNGFPKDMTGQYQRRREAIGETRPGLTEEEVRIAEVNQWFHAGVRRFNKTANDHLADMEHRNYNQDHGLPPPAPCGVIGSGLPKPLSVNEVIAMPLPEASAMMLGPAFGTLLSAADQRPGPNNVRAINKYSPSPAWAIDSTPQGNQSFFGEDWGRAPRRVGRDPRYQPPQE